MCITINRVSASSTLHIHLLTNAPTAHPDPPSFPTRRSSDLQTARPPLPERDRLLAIAADLPTLWDAPSTSAKDRKRLLRALRSEEHTSELQSHSDLVCRLLLEKKNIDSTSSIVSIDCTPYGQ